MMGHAFKRMNPRPAWRQVMGGANVDAAPVPWSGKRERGTHPDAKPAPLTKEFDSPSARASNLTAAVQRSADPFRALVRCDCAAVSAGTSPPPQLPLSDKPSLLLLHNAASDPTCLLATSAAACQTWRPPCTSKQSKHHSLSSRPPPYDLRVSILAEERAGLYGRLQFPTESILCSKPGWPWPHPARCRLCSHLRRRTPRQSAYNGLAIAAVRLAREGADNVCCHCQHDGQPSTSATSTPAGQWVRRPAALPRSRTSSSPTTAESTISASAHPAWSTAIWPATTT